VKNTKEKEDQEKKSTRCTNNRIDQFLLDNLYQTVQKQCPYRVNTETLQLRDQALVCFLILTGVRNSETQKITKCHTRVYKKYVLVANVQPVKNGKLRNKIILPKSGGLAPFTAIFEKWLLQVPDEKSILFPSANTDGSLM
jgi:site-specific recombinase XerD